MNKEKKQLKIHNSTTEFLILTSQSGAGSIEVRCENETIWLTQKLIAELFQKDVRTISEHLKNIYFEEELTPDSTIRKFRMDRGSAARGANSSSYLVQRLSEYNKERSQKWLRFRSSLSSSMR
ncbi:MAG: hypothetical protein KAW14_03510 [Candidatus Aegiribacteria sp.]|nr:hypothetical protein [Candidatus Aegiribacteria sp.]